MKYRVLKIALFMIAGMVIISCKKEDPPDPDKDLPLVFSSIQAARTTIFTEDTTRIWTQASGYKITYHWNVEKGDLLGAGSEVIFVATPCTIGNNIIYCTIRDGNERETTRQVTITVL